MKQFKLYNTYIHENVTMNIAILNKQKCHFFFHKIRDLEGRTSPSWEVGTSRRGGYGGSAWEGEYGTNTVYTCV
jgi:hypothetical protein